MKLLCSAALAALALASVAAAKPVDPGQEQACAADVADKQGMDMSDIRVVHSEGSESGVAEVVLEYPGGAARCMVDGDYNILDIRWNHEEGVSHNVSPAADKTGQEQACAGYFAQQMNEDMSTVRVVSSKPKKHGHLLVVVAVPGMKASCNVDAHYNVVGFKFLGDS